MWLEAPELELSRDEAKARMFVLKNRDGLIGYMDAKINIPTRRFKDAVVELWKSDFPLPHLLVGACLPQRWFSKAWQGGRRGGWIVTIRFVGTQRVSADLQKYLEGCTVSVSDPNERRRK